MSAAIFNEEWYIGIIDRFSPESNGDVAAAIDGLARAILAAACIVTQQMQMSEKEREGSNA